MKKLMNAADKFLDGEFESQRNMIRDAIDNPENPYHTYMLRVIKETDEEVLKKFIVNFFLNVNIKGWAIQEENRKKYGCNIPWAILLDPCVFIHYSDSNIRKQTLLEALQRPIFMAYHDGQPFNENMLRPCPMLENPQCLRKMVEKTQAHSTDLQSPESAEHLCAKCDKYAEHWKPVAEELWEKEKSSKVES